MLAIRVLTAAALLAAFLAAVLYLGQGAFAVAVGAIVALGAREWARLTGLAGWAGFSYAAGCTALFAGTALWNWPLRAGEAPLLAVFGAAAAFWGLAVPAWLARGMGGASRRLLPPAGLAVLLPAALAMVALPPRLLLALLGLVWTADTAAYVAGRAFGRHRLAPAISPGKTWEGVAGAVLGSLAYAIILEATMPDIGARVSGVAWTAYLAGAAALCTTSIVGDLFESAIKRQAGVKDSGTLLPGHGGVLDRIDSATAALPVGALLLAWAGAA